MKNTSSRLIAGLAVLGVVALSAGALFLDGDTATAADHLDPPSRTDGSPAEDIADLYLFTTGTADTDSVVAVLTFGGLVPSGGAAKYDRDVLYQVHLFDGDATMANADVSDDITISVRFGQDASDNSWGVQVNGLPGQTEALEGAVETELTAGNIKVQAGLFDDPFFFDLTGFNMITATGNLIEDNGTPNFTGTDTLAGTNVHAIVIEIPKTELSALTAGPINAWASTSKFVAQ